MSVLVLMVSIEHLTTVVKRSIESALTPAPLFLAVCRIDLQMSSGREWGWVCVVVLEGGGGGGLVVWLCGCVVVWLCGCVVVWCMHHKG